MSQINSSQVKNGTLLDEDIAPNAGIQDTKLGTISTPGKVANSATSATASKTAYSIVLRDGSGNLSLTQAETHNSPDTDISHTALHHTLGAASNQAAPGDHTHTPASIGAIAITEKGAANGVATLGATGVIPNSQLPPLAIHEIFTVSSQAAMLALTAQRGDVAIRSDLNKTYFLATDDPTQLGNWVEMLASFSGVTSFNGRSGAVAPADADYAASLISITTIAGISSTRVQGALSEIQTGKLNSSETATVATANKILYLNASGVLPASITGDAGSVGGYIPSQAAFNASKIQGITVSTAAPTDQQALVYVAAQNAYVPSTVSSGGSSTVTVENHTETSGSPHVIAAGDQDKVFTNAGASAENYQSLPSASVGLRFTFNIVAAVGMRIVPQSGNYIQVDSMLSKSGGYLESTYVGASITLLAINSTTWVATTLVGQWVMETA